jgi:hypothetical protein
MKIKNKLTIVFSTIIAFVLTLINSFILYVKI